MLVRFHERVLHGLVRLGGVAQVVIRDPGRAALVPGDELRVALARALQLARRLMRLDGGGSGGVRFTGGDESW